MHIFLSSSHGDKYSFINMSSHVVELKHKFIRYFHPSYTTTNKIIFLNTFNGMGFSTEENSVSKKQKKTSDSLPVNKPNTHQNIIIVFSHETYLLYPSVLPNSLDTWICSLSLLHTVQCGI